MPQKKVKLTPPGPPGTQGRQGTLTKAGTALAKAKRAAEKRAEENAAKPPVKPLGAAKDTAAKNATKPPVKPLGARLDQAAANERRAETRKAKKDAAAAAKAAKAEKNKATREANKAAKSAAQAELNKTRAEHLDQHNTYHQTHNNIDSITNDIVNAHINGNHDDLVDHAHHLVNVLNKHGSALKVGTGRTSQSRGHVERVKGLLRKVGKNKEVSADIRRKANTIANDHLTHHVPDAPKAPKPAKPGIVDRIKSMFEEVELHEDYGAGDVGTDEVVRKYKSMTPGEQKNKVKLSESYVLWLEEQEQLDEILNMMRDYHRAWNLHVRAEQKRNNPLAKHGVLGPTVAGIAAYASGPVAHHIAHSVHHLANGNIEGAAVHGVAAGITGGLASHVIGGHVRETHKIFNKLRAQRKQNPVMTTESKHIDNHLEKAYKIVKHHGKEDEIEKMIKILKSRISTRR